MEMSKTNMSVDKRSCNKIFTKLLFFTRLVFFTMLFLMANTPSFAHTCTQTLSPEQAFLAIKQNPKNSPKHHDLTTSSLSTNSLSTNPAVVQNTATYPPPIANFPNRININTANEAELTKLKGIGASKAQNIILYRNSFGKFNHVDDLAKVKGIGKATVDKNRHLISVTP
ncbi:helix-hairpin-helix repeat-containing competence protein ComEA [Moraxella macacae 0408225]|uniref:Helix-hairpin-helix repeat-containing competence protein ComEA n=2 Tax=Moraxella macacae TaxID=765840 RepID=L2F911_9GAMM|nr:helix-hairpin-helix repeat-containing competence protein ComEA [Moraxella macacae 0408225]